MPRADHRTGRRPATTKAWQFVDHFREAAVLGEGWTTLPQLFLEAGYTTVGTGKVFHPNLPPNWDLDKSWDPRMRAGGDWEDWMYPSEPRCPNGTAWCADADDAIYDDSQIAASAVRLLRNASSLLDAGGAPFFLAVGFRKPHLQWRFPKRVLQHYPIELAEVPLPAHPHFPEGAPLVGFHQPVGDFLLAFSDTRACGGENISPTVAFANECQQAWRRAYWAAVSYLDEQIGVLLDELKAVGRAGDTMVVLFGDHGWQRARRLVKRRTCAI